MFSAYAAQAIQLALGLVFLLAVVPKLRRPRRFVRAVAGYRLLPRSLTPLVAHGLLVVESALALSLLTGLATSVSVPLAIMTLAVFLTAAGYTLSRGRRIPCGCFGDSELLSARTLVRLALLLGAAMLLQVLRLAAPPLTVSDLGFGLSMALTLLVLGTWLLHVPELTRVLRR